MATIKTAKSASEELDITARNARIVQDRAAVKGEILEVIKPHQQSEAKPPFSASELVVMAVFCSIKASIRKSEIMAWVCDTFPYYLRAAMQAHVRAQMREFDARGDSETPREIDKGFHEVFSEYDVPLRNAGGKRVVGCDDRNEAPWDVIIDAGPGRVYLRKWLEPERKGTFPFLQLSRELRDEM